jgi:hypothetical protein
MDNLTFQCFWWDAMTVPWALLNRYQAAFHHALPLWVKGRGARLAHSQALQNLLFQKGLEVTALLTM